MDCRAIKVPRGLLETLVVRGLPGPQAPLRVGPLDPVGPPDSQEPRDPMDFQEKQDQSAPTPDLDLRGTPGPQGPMEDQVSRAPLGTPGRVLLFQETKETMETQAAPGPQGPPGPWAPEGEQGSPGSQEPKGCEGRLDTWESRAPGGLEVRRALRASLG